MGWFVDLIVLPIAKLVNGLRAHDRPTNADRECESFHTVIRGKPTGETEFPSQREDDDVPADVRAFQERHTDEEFDRIVRLSENDEKGGA